MRVCCLVLLTATSQLEAQKQLERRRLPATVVIDGITCGPTGRAFAEFHSSGRLAECPLANDTVLGGHSLPATAWVSFTEDGAIHGAWLPRDTKLGGHVCHGTGYKGFRVLFHSNGALRLCFLAADTEIQGVPCIHGSFWTEIRGGGKSAVHFRDDGQLVRCQASRTFTRDAIEVRRWQTATFDLQGRLMDPKKPHGQLSAKRLP
jgi:hypothetical protein